MFTSIKQEDVRRNARLTWTQFVYDIGPNGSLINKRRSSSIQSSTNRVGIQRVMLYNRTTDWKPGKFSVSPVIQRSVSTVCTSGTVELYRLYNGRSYVSHILQGEVGAWLGTPSAGSITTGPVEQPIFGSELLWNATTNASQASLEAGVMLGELKETLQMLVNPLQGLYSFLKKNPFPRTLRLKLASRSALSKNQAKQFSDWWLTARFGVVPFLNDVSSVIQEATRMVYRESPIMHSRSVRPESSSQKESYTGTMFNVPVWGNVYTRTRSRVMATVYYNRFYWDKYERYGLDWSQLPGIIWELIPYSFLMDRVVNIGQWLEVMRPKQNFTILGSTISYKTTSECIFHANTATLTTPSNVRTGIDHLCRTTSVQYSRTVPGPLPTSPVVNLNIGGLVKTLDHLTLLTQRIVNTMR